jgi:PmbA protein
MIPQMWADRISQQLSSSGFPRWDCLIVASKDRQVSWRNGEVEDIKETIEIGYGIRLWKDDRLALAYANDPSTEVIRQTIEKAKFMLSYATPDPFNTITETITSGGWLPEPDPDITHRPVSQKMALLRELEKTIRSKDARISKVEHLGFSESLSQMMYRTDRTEWSVQNEGHAGVGGEVIAESEGEMEAGSAYDYKTRWSEIDFQRLASRIAESATDQIGGKSVKTGLIPVIFDPEVTAHFLGTFMDLFSADKIQNQRSVLAGKKGKVIGAPLIQLSDNALLPYQLGSYAWDAEGTAGGLTSLMTNGVLSEYLYDRRTASKEGRSSTGHGHRHSYRVGPQISPSNLILSPGDQSLQELMSLFPQCFLVKQAMGMHTSNTVNGDFSVGATGMWVEKGHIVHPVKQVTLAGNWLSVLTDIVQIGRDVDNFPIHGNIITPSVAIEKLNLSGL